MKRFVLLVFMFALVLCCTATGCSGDEKKTNASTQTIEPATPGSGGKPGAPKSGAQPV